MASLKDIAVKTGLSMNTVSRAIRRSGYVSEKARKLVDAAAKELNYQPNRAAQSLRSSRSYEIAVISIVGNPSSRCDSMAMDKFFGIKEYLSSQNYEPGMHFMYHSPDYAVESERLFKNLLRQKPAGIIFLSEDAMASRLYVRAESFGIPAMLISYAGNLEHDSVYIDRKQGVYDAFRYLYESGRQAIVFAGHDSSGQRFEGYRAAAEEYGLPLRIMDNAAGFGTRLDSISQIGQNMAVDILGRYPEADGIIAYSDYLASGIALGLQGRGKRIPQDIALIGFDNRELAMFSSPPLTTIAQPNRELGNLTAKALLSKIFDKNKEKIQIKVKMTLVKRQSA
jgi:LacI family transcriptional regulator